MGPYTLPPGPLHKKVMSASAEADACPTAPKSTSGRSGFRASQGKACNGRHRNLQQGILEVRCMRCDGLQGRPYTGLGFLRGPTSYHRRQSPRRWSDGLACFKALWYRKVLQRQPWQAATQRDPKTGVQARLQAPPQIPKWDPLSDRRTERERGYQAPRSGASLVCSA